MDILNDEWPRSRTLRDRSLASSRPELPACVALVQWFGETPRVLGHAKVGRVLASSESPGGGGGGSVWIESVVVRRDLRGRGLGKYLMLLTEKMCRKEWGATTAYLCTFDRQEFYSGLGYSFCAPVCAYGGSVAPPARLQHGGGTNGQIERGPGSLNASPPKNSGASASQQDSTPAPPPPPPPPPPSARPLISRSSDFSDSTSSQDDNADVAQRCAKVFKRPSLSDIIVRWPTEPPSELSFLKDCQAPRRDVKPTVHRITLQKDTMKKSLV